MTMRTLAGLGLAAALLLPDVASAFIHEECRGIPKPPDYNERVQQDFLNNYVALATALSPVHGPVPHEHGRGAIGLDVGLIPPLSCEKRFVLEHTKTEDTNKTPILPRPRLTIAFPQFGDLPLVLYTGLAYVPPVNVGGTRNVIVSGELGIGSDVVSRLQLGARFHFTLQKTIGDIATPFVEDDPVFLDFYSASTVGIDGMVGLDFEPIVVYAAAGLTDVSTFFYIGDDGVTGNNFHPYFGPALSAGIDGLVVERFRFGAEFYAAPGGVSKPDESVNTVKPTSRYGNIATGKIRLAFEL